MLNALDNLPEDPVELRRVTELLASEVKAQALMIEKLQHQLHGANRHRFGSKSEGMDQLQLFAENEEIAEAAVKAAETAPAEPIELKEKPRRKPLPDHLERIEQVLSVGEDCPECGGDLSKLGEDITEELEYIPGRFVVNKITRPRMACRRCEAISQAPMPSRPIERGRPGPGLLAHVLVSKFADHLPLYRQLANLSTAPLLRVSIWIARLWQIGWANLPGFWNHWPRPLQNGPKVAIPVCR